MTAQHSEETVLVTGASGAQGGAVVSALSRAGARVRAVVQDGLPPPVLRQVAVVTADLTDPATCAAAFEGAARAWVHLPLRYDADWVDRYARTVAAAAGRAGLRRMVLSVGTRLPSVGTDLAAFETRRRAAEVLLSSGVPTVVLQPTLYLENLLTPPVRAGLAHGVLSYPVPAEAPIAWLSHADLAAWSLVALDRADPGATLLAGGPEPLTGRDLAERLGRALGRPLAFRPQPISEFAAGLGAAIGASDAAAVASTYDWLVRQPDLHAATTESPRPGPGGLTTFETWAGSQSWLVEATT